MAGDFFLLSLLSCPLDFSSGFTVEFQKDLTLFKEEEEVVIREQILNVLKSGGIFTKVLYDTLEENNGYLIPRHTFRARLSELRMEGKVLKYGEYLILG